MTKHRAAPRSSGLRNIGIFFVVIAALYVARELLIPLAFAITLSMILAPSVNWLAKHGLRRAFASILVMVVAVAIVGGMGWVIFSDLVEVTNQLPQYAENIDKKILALNATGRSSLGHAAESVKQLQAELQKATAPAVTKNETGVTVPAPRPLPVRVVAETRNQFQSIGDIVMPFLRPLAVFGMVLIFSLYLLIDSNDLLNRLFRLVGVHQLNVMTQALNDATQRVSRYLMLQLLVNVCFGVLCGAGLYFIGVPYAALWGAVAGLVRIVPYLGSMIAAALPLALSLAVFDGWIPPLLVFVLFAGLELTTGNFVEPWLYGIHTGVSSLALLLTTVFWAALWGPAGLILSTPLTVCAVVLGRYAPQFSFLHILLADEEPLLEEARIYQRLLAMDEQEARAIAARYLKEHSLAQLYDLVLIPMLTLAEQDRHKGALEPVREEFLFLSMKEMMAELPDDAAKSGEAVEPRTATAWPGRVICLPASDEADEICATMLSQLLELGGYATLAFPVDPDLLQLMQVLDLSADDVICISALPPFAFSSAKTLTRQLRTRFPHTRLVVGVWGFAGDTELSLDRFQAPRPDRLAATLEQALQTVAELVAPPVVSQETAQ